jgi:hypothetical protein
MGNSVNTRKEYKFYPKRMYYENYSHMGWRSQRSGWNYRYRKYDLHSSPTATKESSLESYTDHFTWPFKSEKQELHKEFYESSSKVPLEPIIRKDNIKLALMGVCV